MTAETRLAQLRLEERDLLNTKCARCGHRLGAHSRIQQTCIGSQGPSCRCKDFVETLDEQLALK